MTTSATKSLFGRRLKDARTALGLAQDKLGVMIGLDESCSSARMSRYENGIHAPAFEIVEKLAQVLNLPASYFYCDDDELADLLVIYQRANNEFRKAILKFATCKNKS